MRVRIELNAPKIINGVQFNAGDVLADLVLRQGVTPEKLDLCLQARIAVLKAEPIAAEVPSVEETKPAAVGKRGRGRGAAPLDAQE